MLQYLLNTTAIWLTSLVLFDVFLRRESYHSYNRFYLLFTFLLGLFLPLLQWQNTGQAYQSTIARPIQQIITVKQTIVTAAAPVATTINWQQWLTIIYSFGVFITLCLLIIEIIKLITVYRAGRRSAQNGWTLIETGKEHAPFSFINTLFVCSIQQYNAEEWKMILTHEKRHTSLLHIADLLLMQLARLVFWFHPLVYVYNKRLLLVHEYQADNASAQQPQVYGHFLVEQSILQSAPSLSHSFNRSPIKSRILMLTRRSSIAAKTKMLVFIPLLMVCLLCFSKNIFSQKKTGAHNPIARLGNTDTGDYLHHKYITTYEQVLSNPVVTCTEPGWEITDFTISFQPKGKDYYGPFASKSAKIPEVPMSRIQQFKTEKIDTVRIFVEEIHAKHNGATVTLSPIILRMVQP